MAAARTSRDEWVERVESWLASGLSGREFARRAGINSNTLFWWKWKLQNEGMQWGQRRKRSRSPSFVEISEAVLPVVAAEVEDRLELAVGSVTVRVPDAFEERTLARVLAVLEASQ